MTTQLQTPFQVWKLADNLKITALFFLKMHKLSCPDNNFTMAAPSISFSQIYAPEIETSHCQRFIYCYVCLVGMKSGGSSKPHSIDMSVL